jgi:hypothetical protein
MFKRFGFGLMILFLAGAIVSACNFPVPAVVPFMGVVAPGGTIDLSVSLVAPGDPGAYQGFCKLRNSGGLLFGLGGNSAFWVRIKVPALAEDDDDIVFIPQIPIIPLPYLRRAEQISPLIITNALTWMKG